jgi:hypothetical protein
MQTISSQWSLVSINIDGSVEPQSCMPHQQYAEHQHALIVAWPRCLQALLQISRVDYNYNGLGSPVHTTPHLLCLRVKHRYHWHSVLQPYSRPTVNFFQFSLHEPFQRTNVFYFHLLHKMQFKCCTVKETRNLTTETTKAKPPWSYQIGQQ